MDRQGESQNNLSALGILKFGQRWGGSKTQYFNDHGFGPTLHEKVQEGYQMSEGTDNLEKAPEGTQEQELPQQSLRDLKPEFDRMLVNSGLQLPEDLKYFRGAVGFFTADFGAIELQVLSAYKAGKLPLQEQAELTVLEATQGKSVGSALLANLLQIAKENILMARRQQNLAVDKALKDLDTLSKADEKHRSKNIRGGKMTTITGLRDMYIIYFGWFVYTKFKGWIYHPNNQELIKFARRFRNTKLAKSYALAIQQEAEKDWDKFIGDIRQQVESFRIGEE
jgi:GNAT superfamily N-acetyltransferase